MIGMVKTKRKVLRWRRVAMISGPLGWSRDRAYELWYGDEPIGRASERGRFAGGGYYWWAGTCDVPHHNSTGHPLATIGEARAECLAYVRNHLAQPSLAAV